MPASQPASLVASRQSPVARHQSPVNSVSQHPSLQASPRLQASTSSTVTSLPLSLSLSLSLVTRNGDSTH
ncbi:predicted protein [Plenodomus lingam JN3]|uniref:Predicted protein n=1 Tax=Leptosphaeria maculans (strain JN3 / isolate v23.1.3 / race Av1-4-5-6-7-8) TaxID=985895 RepID=E5AEM2_LEPMJ|nr:predicted protein [Plenodomus lingam JN3]CBY01661.1 predicted protein [Plenodomus lingam JN3]